MTKRHLPGSLSKNIRATAQTHLPLKIAHDQPRASDRARSFGRGHGPLQVGGGTLSFGHRPCPSELRLGGAAGGGRILATWCQCGWRASGLMRGHGLPVVAACPVRLASTGSGMPVTGAVCRPGQRVAQPGGVVLVGSGRSRSPGSDDGPDCSDQSGQLRLCPRTRLLERNVLETSLPPWNRKPGGQGSAVFIRNVLP